MALVACCGHGGQGPPQGPSKGLEEGFDFSIELMRLESKKLMLIWTSLPTVRRFHMWVTHTLMR